MKVFLVTYFFGKLVASIGPLPYDVNECLSRKVEFDQDVDAAFADPVKAPQMVAFGKLMHREDVKLACIESETRPVIEGPTVTLGPDK